MRPRDYTLSERVQHLEEDVSEMEKDIQNIFEELEKIELQLQNLNECAVVMKQLLNGENN